MGKFSVIRIAPVEMTSSVGIGQLPVGSRVFSLRADVKPHAHKPLGQFYCGQCFHWVRVEA